MELLLILDLIGLTFGIAGVILVGNKKRLGFLFFILSSVGHGWVGAVQANSGLALKCGVWIALNTYYYLRWSENDECKETKKK